MNFIKKTWENELNKSILKSPPERLRLHKVYQRNKGKILIIMLSEGYFFYNLANWLTHIVRGNDEIISGHEYISTVFIYIYFNVLQKISKETLKIHSEQLCFA